MEIRVYIRQTSILLKIAWTLGLAVIPGFAGTTLYQGAFAGDDDTEQFQIDVAVAETVTIESWGYAGGTVPTTPSPTVITAGGFAPNIIVFDPTGNEIASDAGGHCGITATDPVTGNCDDSYIEETLDPGNYTMALVEYDNEPTDTLLADGFMQDGNLGFTCAEFGLMGNFCDVTTALGTERDGNYAVSVTTAEIVSTPEPATFSLFCLAGCFLCGAVFPAARVGCKSLPGEAR
jgi:hypothetical protein